MNRTILGLLTILLVITACSPAVAAPAVTATPTVARSAVSPTATVAPAALAHPTLDPTSVIGNPSTPWDASRVNAAAKDFKTGMREASGMRAQLGSQADEFFRLIDQAETAAVQDLLRQLQVGGKPKGLPAPLPPRTASMHGSNQILGFASILTTFLEAPNLVQRPDYDRGMRDQPLTVKETDQALGDNVRSHAKVQTRVTGCRADMEVEITVRGEKDGKVYEEHAHGKLSLPICPDNAGKVPVDLSLQVSASLAAAGYQFQTDFTGHAVGLVDDDANLVGIEQDLTTNTDVQAGQGAKTVGGETHSIMQGTVHYTMQGLNTEHLSATDAREEWRGTPKAAENIGKLANLTPSMAFTIELMALREAENKWKDNYCVAIRVDNADQTVLAGSETPLTARLQHQFEGRELNFPIIATLKSGGVSVTPSGVKVPAPATFRYQAPEAAGEEAIVELISRSRRGIGKLNVTFRTESPYFYAVGEFAAGTNISAFGEICALDKPFKLSVYGQNPSGGDWQGEVAFTPSSITTGSWKQTATTCEPGGTCGLVSMIGTYQVEGVAGTKPVIAMNSTTERMGIPGGKTKSFVVPAWQIELTPRTGVCSPE